MSVSLLLAAVAARPSPILAIVSADLFNDLLVAGELDVSFQSVYVPSDPKYRDVMDELTRSMGGDPNAPMQVPVYTLKKYPHVQVQLDHHHGLTLAPTGPNAFRVV